MKLNSFLGVMHTFVNQASIDGFKRLIDDKFPDKALFRSILSDTYDILLFEAQHATLLQLFGKKLKTPKGKDLYREYGKKMDDAIQVWHRLLIHQNGSNIMQA